MGTYYDLGPFDPAVTAELRARSEAESAAMALPDGRLPCGMAVHLAMAVRGRGVWGEPKEGRRI